MHAKEVWVRIVSLPLYLWCWEVLKRLGDCCGGFLVVDEDVAHLRNLEWISVLVRSYGRKTPR